MSDYIDKYISIMSNSEQRSRSNSVEDVPSVEHHHITNPDLDAYEDMRGEARDLFGALDSHGNGLVSAKEVTRMFKLLGALPSDESIDVFLRAVDANGDGLVSLKEFTDALSRRVTPESIAALIPPPREVTIAEVRDAFRFIAKDAGAEPRAVPAAALQRVLAAFTPSIDAGGATRGRSARRSAPLSKPPEPTRETVLSACAAADANEARAWALLRAQSITGGTVDALSLVDLLMENEQ